MPWPNVYANSYNPSHYLNLEKPNVEQRSGSSTVRQMLFNTWPTFFSLLPLSGRRWFPTELKPTQYQESLTLVWPSLSLATKKVTFEEFFTTIYNYFLEYFKKCLPSLFLSMLSALVWERRNLSSGHSRIALLDLAFQRVYRSPMIHL